MITLQLNLKPETERRLKRILDDYADNEILAQNIIAYQISELKKAIINIYVDLKQFEDKYQLGTEQFYEIFEDGSLGDEKDYIIWSGIYEMYLENKRKLEALE